jgi:hypothetical protein
VKRISLVAFVLFAAAARDQARAECDAVGVALGKAALIDCPGIDRNGDGGVSVAEILGGGASHAPSPRGADVVSIDVGSASGAPGASVTVQITLDTGGAEVAGTQNDIAFDPLTPISGCTVNPGIDKDVFTGYQPASCTYGVDCTAIRVIVISLSNLDPIPDGLLYSCNVDIAPTAPPAVYPLANSNEGAARPDAQALVTEGADGAVIVTAGLDHFKCYKVKDLKQPKFAKTTVALADQFVDGSADVKKPFLLCNPVSKNGEGINNSVDHLTCYKIKTPPLEPRPNVQVSNQLGTLKLQAKKAFLLCVPSSKLDLP